MKNNAIMDYLLSFKNSNEMKSFLDDNKYFETLNDQEKYFWKILNNDEFEKIPKFIIDEQERIKRIIEDNNNISISAPTSFGKSHIIIEQIKQTKDKRAIISPTISLCNEYFLKISSDTKSVSMSPHVEANIYILTPEKFMTLCEVYPEIKFDLIVLDEFYEAFSGDRFSVFSDAHDNAIKMSKKIIKISPHINAKFPDKFNATKQITTDFSSTTRRIYKYTEQRNGTFKKFKSTEFNQDGTDGYEVECNYKNQQEILISTLKETTKKKSNVIVLSSKNQMFEYLKIVKESLDLPKKTSFLITQIKKYLDKTAKHTMLAKYIEYGVAYHNGTMDKFLRFLIEAAFTAGEINILFGNSALTKGVNLSPDVLFILKYTGARSKKVSDAIKKIEKINAYGRTGRAHTNKQIGNLIFITKTNVKDENDDKLIKGGTGILNIEEPIIDNPTNINSFESAYKKFIVNKVNFDISDENKKLIINYLKRESDLEKNNVADILFDAIKSIFKIDFGNAEIPKRILIETYIYKQGYSKLLQRYRTRIIELGYITGLGWPTDKEHYIANGKKVFNIKFVKNTKHEDLILKNAYEDYENEAGFYFAQLLSKVIKEIQQDSSYTDIIKKYFDRMKNEESIATNNNWPESFGDYFIQSGQTNETKEYLDKLINNIRKKY